MPHHEARGLLNQKLRGLLNQKLRGLLNQKLRGLLNQKLRGLLNQKLRGLLNQKLRGLLNQKFRSSFNSISSWTGKTFLATNLLKQESWKQGAETGKSENFAFEMRMEVGHLV